MLRDEDVQPETSGEAYDADNLIAEAAPVKAVPLATNAAVLGAASVGLAACGGGGGGGGGVTPSPPPPPTSFNYPAAEAARFLLQAQFAFSDADLATLNTQGYDGWLTAQFNSSLSQGAIAWLTAQGHSTPRHDGNYFNPTPGDFMAWRMMMTGNDQLRKRCALAVSEMMVASLNPIDGFWPPQVIGGYWDMLNANVFGNFRTLLEAVTLNPAMGFFLNTKGNLKEDPDSGREPDENYAREIMQLFTIGLYQLNTDGSIKTDLFGNKLETYVQSDISNLARVFTGYDWNYSRVTWQDGFESYPVPTIEFASDPMSFKAEDHSMLEVNFLGTNIPANTPGPQALKIALDALFNHANVGPFFARQMIQRLITSNPSPAYIQRVAQKFNDNGSGVRGDLKAFWRAILMDPDARNVPGSNRAGKLREPMIRWTQWARTFSVVSSTGKWEIYDTSSADWGLGQSPLRSPSVFNYFRPGYVPPQTEIAAGGDVAPEFQLHNETTVAGYVNFFSSIIRDGYGDVKPDYTAMMALVTDSQKLVDWLGLHLSANQVSAATLTRIKGALDANPVTTASTNDEKLDRICNAVLLIMSCPEYLVQK